MCYREVLYAKRGVHCSPPKHAGAPHYDINSVAPFFKGNSWWTRVVLNANLVVRTNIIENNRVGSLHAVEIYCRSNITNAAEGCAPLYALVVSMPNAKLMGLRGNDSIIHVNPHGVIL